MMEMMLINVDLASSSMVIRVVVVSSMYSVTVTTSYMTVSILFRVKPPEGLAYHRPKVGSPAADACCASAGVFPEGGW